MGVGNKIRAKVAYGNSNLIAYLFILPFVILYTTFIVLPMIGIVIKSFTNNNVAALEIFSPHMFRTVEFTLENYVRLFSHPWSLRVLSSTLSVATAALVLSFVIGTPAAYAITRPTFKSSRIVSWFLSLPIYLPTVVTAFALVWFFGSMGVVNTILKGLFGFTVPLAYTFIAVVLGTVCIITPVYIRTVATAFEKIQPEVFEASMSLGANEIYTFWRIALPMVKQMIFAGLIFKYSMTIGMMEMAMVVGGGGVRVQHIAVEIFQSALGFNLNITFASAMATFLLVIALIGQALSLAYLWRSER